MRFLNASDHRWLCIENENNPLQIGGLIFLRCEDHTPEEFASRARQHLTSRLPDTPWSVRYKAAPFNIDSGAWLNIGNVDIDQVTSKWMQSGPVSIEQLTAYVCEQVLIPLPRDRPPFRITFFENLDDSLKQYGDVAMLVQHHHAVADGVGFQNALNAITDDTPVPPATSMRTAHRDRVPIAPIWIAQSLMRARRARVLDEAQTSSRDAATAELQTLRNDPTFKRQRTQEIPVLDGPSSRERSYAFTELDLNHIRSRAKDLGGTVNDLMMTVVGGVFRLHLQEIGELDALGELSAVGIMPRSLRTEADGLYGNYLNMTLPLLGTQIEDHSDRFRFVQQSIRNELRRSQLMHDSMPKYEKPFTARERMKPEVGTSAGNISVSNVPGPSSARWFAGYKMVSNYPTPSLVAGRFMNITLRRYCDSLHLGVMSEPAKLADLDSFVAKIHQVVQEV